MNGAAGRNMPLDEYTLAEALQDSGYTTGLFGKWHLGAHKDYGPKKQGFDHFLDCGVASLTTTTTISYTGTVFQISMTAQLGLTQRETIFRS